MMEAHGVVEPAEALVVVFNIYVDGELVDSEEILSTAKPQELTDLALRQSEICNRAQARDLKYMVDIVWWDGEHTRWGTDVDGVVVPVEVGVEGLAFAIERHFDIGFKAGTETCQAMKIGYVCQRGWPHEPHNLHAQLMAHLPDDKIRVAIWQEGRGGVRVTKIDAPRWRGLAG
jgi:hypothetical protein